MFHAMDDDGNGTIEKEELESYMRNMVQMLKILFPKVMEFQQLQGNAETKAAMKHAQDLLTQKGQVWLERKEQRILAECKEIWGVCLKDRKGRVTEKAWLDAFQREDMIADLTSLQVCGRDCTNTPDCTAH